MLEVRQRFMLSVSYCSFILGSRFLPLKYPISDYLKYNLYVGVDTEFESCRS